MNYKLRIYCTLLLFVIVVSVLTSTCHTGYTESSQQPAAAGEMRLEVLDSPANFGSTETDSNGATSYHTVTYEVNVVPNAQGKSLFSSVGTPSDNQTYKVKMQKAKLEIAASDAPFGNFQTWIYITLAVVIIGFAIWFLGIVFTTIRSIRMGEIFISQVSKNIEKIGIILCAIYMVEWIASYVVTQYFISHIQLAYYSIVYKNDCNIMFLIMGLSLMVISQVILMGKEMKEEQDLTI